MTKKIVILSAFVSPLRSGAEACAEEVAARLHGEYDITIIAARMRDDLPYMEKLPSGVKVWRVGLGKGIDKWLYPFLAPRVARALKPDIVHAVLESYAGLAMVLCRWMVPTAKRLLTCQSTNTTMLVRLMHRHAHAVTAISTVLVERAKRFGKDAVHIPNGIDLALIDEALQQHPKVDGRVLFVGRLEKMKGVDVLLAALTEFRIQNSEFNDVHLRIVGDGSLRRVLEQQVKDVGLGDVVTFAGYVPAQRVAAEFAQAQIFCGLSRSEALGNVFLEAQAAECAVIATTVGGIPDIVHDGETGLLVPPDNAHAAAAALGTLVEDGALRGRLSAAGSTHARQYDWSAIARQYVGVYEDLLAS